MTMMLEEKMKTWIQKARKVNIHSSATCIAFKHCHFQLRCRHIVARIQTGFLFFIIIFLRFNIVELSQPFSAFYVHSLQVPRAFPLSKLVIEFHSKCCCCVALYFSLCSVVIVAADECDVKLNYEFYHFSVCAGLSWAEYNFFLFPIPVCINV